MFTISLTFLHIFQDEKKIMSLYNRFNQLAFVTEALFSVRNFCGRQKFVSVKETVNLQEKVVFRQKLGEKYVSWMEISFIL